MYFNSKIVYTSKRLQNSPTSLAPCIWHTQLISYKEKAPHSAEKLWGASDRAGSKRRLYLISLSSSPSPFFVSGSTSQRKSTGGPTLWRVWARRTPWRLLFVTSVRRTKHHPLKSVEIHIHLTSGLRKLKK